MARTNPILQLALFMTLLAGAACGPPDPGTPDGGDPVDAGPGPVFLDGPRIAARGPESLDVTFRADVPVTATLQWRGADVLGQLQVEEAASEHRVTVTGLVPGRTFEIAVAARDAAGQTRVGSLEARTDLRPGGPWRVLFDAAHGQEAGNADWVIDDADRYPSPGDPSHEEDWCGAYSAFGVDLVKSGLFQVEILSGGNLTFGTGASQDLSRYDILVIPEPNSPFDTSEGAAVEGFVRGGGGLLLIGNHRGADRDNDGWDAVRAFEALLQGREFGAYFIGDRRSGTAAPQPGEPIADGPFGVVEAMGCFSGTAVGARPAENPTVRIVSSIGGGKGPLAVAGRLGEGRFVFHGDSSAADDGSACSNDSEIYDSWTHPEDADGNPLDQQNDRFFLNAVTWLTGAY